VANTLFFGGEATNSDGHSGTVHGAIATGYRAADEILTVTSRGCEFSRTIDHLSR